jgi:DHA2 family multidrug resistance protein
MIGAVLYGSTMILPLFLQSLMGYTATKSGEVLSPGGMVTLIAMPIAGYLVAKVNLRWLLNIGLVSGALALFYMAGYNLQTPFWTAVHGRVFQSAGLAFLFVPINTAAFAYIARKNTNNASGIINLSRNIGGSVGIALCSTAITQQAQVHQNILAGHLSALRPEYFWQFNQVKAMLFMKGASLPVAEQQANAMYYGMLRMQSSMLAYVDVFRWMGWAFLALIPLTFLLKSRKISSKTNMPIH